MGKFLQTREEVNIAQTEDAGIYEVKEPLTYITNSGIQINIPTDFLTDGYSKPGITKGLVNGSFEDDIRPAILHDYLCKYKGYIDTTGVFVPVAFNLANNLFYEAMTEVKMPLWRRIIYRICVELNPQRW